MCGSVDFKTKSQVVVFCDVAFKHCATSSALRQNGADRLSAIGKDSIGSGVGMTMAFGTMGLIVVAAAGGEEGGGGLTTSVSC